ncbi:serine hydrolase [Nitrospira defluvii]|nr:serine hydrolase [Nitrospira defluvii]
MSDLIADKMHEGITKGVFPGAVLLIDYCDQIVFHEAFGFAEITPNRIEVTCETIFDIASLTKPLVTAAATAFLLQQGELSLDDRVARYLPLFSSRQKNCVTLFHLLNHSSGVPDWKPYFEEISTRNAKEKGFLGSTEAKEAIYLNAQQENLIAFPGKRSLYSDIGFILLGEIVEKVCGLPMDLFCHEKLFSNIEFDTPFFIPRNQGTSETHPKMFAATEDLSWRKGVIRGIVHDDNAYAMGGVSGHAGLFSTATGVYQCVRLWVDSMNGTGPFDREIVDDFATRQEGAQCPEGSSWGLGWDTPSPASQGEARGISSSGHFFSPQSFGHLGYTGTSIWVDREKNLIVILLTNRVHPTHENKKIQAFRPELHDVVFKEVVGG